MVSRCRRRTAFPQTIAARSPNAGAAGSSPAGPAGRAAHGQHAVVGRRELGAASRSGPPPLQSLEGKFLDPDGYPSHYSDVSAALMTLNHQFRMINLMTRVGYETRIALEQLQKNAQSGNGSRQSPDRGRCQRVRRLSPVRSTRSPLPEKFESTSGFQQQFRALWTARPSRSQPWKTQSGSRKPAAPLSLHCYMIYSPAFDGLPQATRDAIYARMWDVLSGKDQARKYARLTPQLRADIVDILLDTESRLCPSISHPFAVKTGRGTVFLGRHAFSIRRRTTVVAPAAMTAPERPARRCQRCGQFDCVAPRCFSLDTAARPSGPSPARD